MMLSRKTALGLILTMLVVSTVVLLLVACGPTPEPQAIVQTKFVEAVEVSIETPIATLEPEATEAIPEATEAVPEDTLIDLGSGLPCDPDSPGDEHLVPLSNTVPVSVPNLYREDGPPAWSVEYENELEQVFRITVSGKSEEAVQAYLNEAKVCFQAAPLEWYERLFDILDEMIRESSAGITLEDYSEMRMAGNWQTLEEFIVDATGRTKEDVLTDAGKRAIEEAYDNGTLIEEHYERLWQALDYDFDSFMSEAIQLHMDDEPWGRKLPWEELLQQLDWAKSMLFDSSPDWWVLPGLRDRLGAATLEEILARTIVQSLNLGLEDIKDIHQEYEEKYEAGEWLTLADFLEARDIDPKYIIETVRDLANEEVGLAFPWEGWLAWMIEEKQDPEIPFLLTLGLEEESRKIGHILLGDYGPAGDGHLVIDMEWQNADEWLNANAQGNPEDYHHAIYFSIDPKVKKGQFHDYVSRPAPRLSAGIKRVKEGRVKLKFWRLPPPPGGNPIGTQKRGIGTYDDRLPGGTGDIGKKANFDIWVKGLDPGWNKYEIFGNWVRDK